ncbi:MAG: nitrate/nitrite transporter NrtS [Cyanobacteria bacterium P01_D01_bin.6]
MKAQVIRGYFAALIDPTMTGTAIRVAIVMGTLLFTINHGIALTQGKMTRTRWLSAVLTYCVPYAVNIHGQYMMKGRRLVE